MLKQSMNNRERIIIVLAILAAFYGVFNYFIFSSSKKSKNEMVQSETTKKNLEMITKIDENLISLKVLSENNEEVAYLISMIESEWENDPFIKFEKSLEKTIEKNLESAKTKDNIDLNYSGFIQFGEKILAVINGMEYETGEHIRGTEYEIVRITSNTVVLNIDKNRQTMLFLKEE